jgi:endogenous inhibitor of DNA gyrase (YacG/DUF329 family)
LIFIAARVMSRPAAADPNARTVRCPACGGPSLYAPANRWRPFCSQRCKLQDLGDWANERFRVEMSESDGGLGDADPSAGDDVPKPQTH